MGANKPTTFWVSRDDGPLSHALFVWPQKPKPYIARHGGCCFSSGGPREMGGIDCTMHQSLGIRTEPRPGTCHEIKWRERTFDLHKEHSVTLWVPTVRDVTDELEESSNA